MRVLIGAVVTTLIAVPAATASARAQRVAAQRCGSAFQAAPDVLREDQRAGTCDRIGKLLFPDDCAC